MLASGNAPLDFHTRAVLNHQLLESSGIDDHHIFPDKFLADRGLVSRQRDIVLNRCLIDRSTNQHISCLAPSSYMAELRDQPNFPMQLVLHSHLIPCETDSGLWNDNYEHFLVQRQALLAAAIHHACGSQAQPPLIT
jgi:hypothetical protein